MTKPHQMPIIRKQSPKPTGFLAASQLMPDGLTSDFCYKKYFPPAFLGLLQCDCPVRAGTAALDALRR
ncbi:hypothetical protein EXN66_Car000527 [Channa argus]|uniref:Uncharacterized protein n=1 Tax=Channa argus TaxID=215402 RepID=A0A6G1QXX3_CHAAH|nr:hypothetical protein EXN66_Car000527 [Channa argus]